MAEELYPYQQALVDAVLDGKGAVKIDYEATERRLLAHYVGPYAMARLTDAPETDAGLTSKSAMLAYAYPSGSQSLAAKFEAGRRIGKSLTMVEYLKWQRAEMLLRSALTEAVEACLPHPPPGCRALRQRLLSSTAIVEP